MRTRRVPRVLRSQHRSVDPVAPAVARRPPLPVVAAALTTSLLLLLLLGQSCAAASVFGRSSSLTAKPQQQRQQQISLATSSSSTRKVNHRIQRQIGEQGGLESLLYAVPLVGGRLLQLRDHFGGCGCAKAEESGVQIVGSSSNGGGMAARAPPPTGNGQGVAKVNGYNSFIAGGLAGSIAMTITCPIEVVKTQLQASSVEKGSNAFSIATQILRTDGPRGFFRGLLPGLVGIVPARSTYFLAYSKSKEFWNNEARLGDRHRDLTEILCGVTAGIVQNTITNPIWMVKTRMQLIADTATGQVAYGGYKQAVGAIWRDEGVRGFYKGMSASYWGCSEGCIYFVLYERLKRRLRNDRNERRAEQGLPPTDSLPPAYLFASSAVSKMCATVATYPHEVIRTRLREQARNGVFKYTGMWQSLILIGREEGRRGLYAGMGTHVARVVPNMAIMMLSFELISDWLNRGEGARHLTLFKQSRT